MTSQITKQLIDQLVSRDAHGRNKYGVTLDRTDLTAPDWLQHMAEELMDGAGYALAAKREIERLMRIEQAAAMIAVGLNENPPRLDHSLLRALNDRLQTGQ